VFVEHQVEFLSLLGRQYPLLHQHVADHFLLEPDLQRAYFPYESVNAQRVRCVRSERFHQGLSLLAQLRARGLELVLECAPLRFELGHLFLRQRKLSAQEREWMRGTMGCVLAAGAEPAFICDGREHRQDDDRENDEYHSECFLSHGLPS
jgi:hypothetical protein